MDVSIVPVLRDNYAYLLVEGTRALVVDPGEARPVLAALEARGLELAAVLATHHHADHVGGIAELRAKATHLRVLGSESDRIPEITDIVSPGTRIDLLGHECAVLDVHCHTRGHVAFRFGDELFTGDTLFAGGCGRFFEGTAKDMHSAFEAILALPTHTRIYCGHEYTIRNLEFALEIEPDNPHIPAMLERARQLQARGEPTVPTTLEDELTYNPFLRASLPELADHVKRLTGRRPSTPVETLAVLRRLKDLAT